MPQNRRYNKCIRKYDLKNKFAALKVDESLQEIKKEKEVTNLVQLKLQKQSQIKEMYNLKSPLEEIKEEVFNEDLQTEIIQYAETKNLPKQALV